jgi:hypothetical protein
MSLMIWLFGGTLLQTPFMVKMYCDMGAPQGGDGACGAGP